MYATGVVQCSTISTAITVCREVIEALLHVHEQVDSRMLKKPVGPFHNLTLRCYL